MGKKLWYEVSILNSDGKREVISKIKSKGLAYNFALNCIKTYNYKDVMIDNIPIKAAANE